VLKPVSSEAGFFVFRQAKAPAQFESGALFDIKQRLLDRSTQIM